MTAALKRLAAAVRAQDDWRERRGRVKWTKLRALLEAVEALQGVYVPREVLLQARRALQIDHDLRNPPSECDGCAALTTIDALLKGAP